MSDPFTLGGSPASIRTSATTWLTFSTSSSEASSDIRSLDSGNFQGDEGDTYRDQVNKDLPPHLDTTSEAWGIVAKALSTYADKLEGFQSRLSTLSAQNSQNQQAVSQAQSSYCSAKAADTAHDQTVAQQKAKLKPGQTLPTDTYQSTSSTASTSLTNAQQAQQDTIDAANKVQSDHETAVNDCVNDINRAKDMRFQKPPGWWDRLTSSVCGWISDHAGMLLKIASVLKTISCVAGILAMIPVLAPVMGPLALATGAAAVGIEATVKLVTGKGSWTSIGLDVLTMTPVGGKLLGLAGKGMARGATALRETESGAKALSALDKVTNAPRYLTSAVKNRASYELSIAKSGLTKLRTVPVGTMEMSGDALVLGGGGGLTHLGNYASDAKAAFVEGRATAAKNFQVQVIVDGEKYPESALHISQAQRGENYAGWDRNMQNSQAQPSDLTIGAKGRAARQRGRGALKDVSPAGSKDGVKYDRDEYPPKMFNEGGSGASVKNIPRSDNRGAGSVIGHSTAGYPTGTGVRITPINVPSI